MCQLDKLRMLRTEIYRIAHKHNVDKVYVFGSCARKEDTPESDIDLLADFNEDASLFDQVVLQLELAEALNSKVDVIPLSSLYAPILALWLRRTWWHYDQRQAAHRSHSPGNGQH